MKRTPKTLLLKKERRINNNVTIKVSPPPSSSSSSKSKKESKGSYKLRSFDVMLNDRLMSWRPVDSGWPEYVADYRMGLTVRDFLDCFVDSDQEYDDYDTRSYCFCAMCDGPGVFGRYAEDGQTDEDCRTDFSSDVGEDGWTDISSDVSSVDFGEYEVVDW